MTYICVILVSIDVPRFWIELMLLNWVIFKDYFYTLYDNFFFLNLRYNVSRYLSIQNAIACFPNSWGILMYRFVTSNVTMSVLGSIFYIIFIYIYIYIYITWWCLWFWVLCFTHSSDSHWDHHVTWIIFKIPTYTYIYIYIYTHTHTCIYIYIYLWIYLVC